MSNMWSEEKILKANQDIAEALKEIADKIGNDSNNDRVDALLAENDGLKRELMILNETYDHLIKILDSFCIPFETKITPYNYDIQTNYDVRANKTAVHVAFEVEGHYRLALKRGVQG